MKTSLFAHLNALSEPIRVRILHVLASAELGVGELARVLQTPQSTVSRHLKLLLDLGLLERRSVGTTSFLRVAEPLPGESAGLWAVVAEQLAGSGQHDEDLRRVQSVLVRRTMDSRTFFGRQADHWESLRRELFGAGYLLPTLAALLPADLAVADLGCGTGEVLRALAPAVRRVVGVDREAAMLRTAAQRTQGLDNVQLVQSGLDALALDDGCLDAALCMLVLHHVQDLSATFAEIRRVLRPGGRLVVLDMVQHDRREYRRTMGHLHLGFSESGLAELALAAGLRPLRWRRLPPEPDVQGPGLFLACYQVGALSPTENPARG